MTSQLPGAGRHAAIARVLAAVLASAALPALAAGPASGAPLHAGTTAARPAAAGLPAAELWIDWRRVTAEDAAPAPDAHGGFVVGTGSPVPPGWSGTRSRDAAPPAPASTARVMNGQEAAWEIDRTRTRRDHDLVWTAQGQGVVSRDTVVHDARSLVATPRWPGGTAPVQLSLSVRTSRPEAGDDEPLDPAADPAQPAARDTALRTTVAVPLDAWVTVARVGAEDVQVRVRRH